MDIIKYKDLEDDYGLEISCSDSESVYPMNNIKVEKGFYTVYELKRKFDKIPFPRIVLDSDFQREDVWGLEKKIELVESVLMGLPLPIFYFNEDKYGKLIVIDGRQRLTSLFEFLDNDFALKKLKILPDLNGKKFNDLSPVLQARIEDYQVQAHVIMPPTPDRIKFDIFDRVNRAGMQLNKQEIRNALYQGKATKLLNEICDSKIFAKATGNAFAKEKRMKNKYIVNRFIAFYLYFNHKIKDSEMDYIYKNDLDDLLGKTLEYLNSAPEIEIEKVKELVLNALRNSYFYLGKDAFRLVKNDGRRSPINMNVFETIMYIMFKIPQEQENIKEIVNNLVLEMVSNNDFLDCIGNHRDNINKVNFRFTYANTIGKEINDVNKA